MSSGRFDLKRIQQLVRDVPNFPKEGILFKDITPALAEPGALDWICGEMAKPFLGKGIQKVLAVESRGFFFGPGIATHLNAGLVPVRKAGKLPWQTIAQSYALEYGEATIELHRDAVHRGESVLLVDDVLATGGTLNATKKLVDQLGGQVFGAACFLELGFLNGRTNLSPLVVESLWKI